MYLETKNIRLLWSFARNHKLYFILSVILVLFGSVILGAALSIVLPISSQIISPNATVTMTGNSYFARVMSFFDNTIGGFEHKQLVSMAILFSGVVFHSVLQFAVAFVNSGLTAKITTECRERIYSVIQKTSMSRFSQSAHGVFIQLLIAETRSVYSLFKYTLTIIAVVINFSVIVVLMLMLSPILSLVLGFTVACSIWATLVITKGIKIFAAKALKSRLKLSTQVSEYILGMKQLRLIQAEPLASERISHDSRRAENLSRTLILRNATLPFITQNLVIVGIVGVIITWFNYPVFPEGVPRVAGLVTFLIVGARLIPYIASLSKEYGGILSNMPAISRIYAILNSASDWEKEGTEEPEPFFKESIRFENVNFGYSVDTSILNSITFTIKKGSYIGIMGRSGVGKTSLFNLLVRIYDPQEGRILVDDLDIRELRLSNLRSNIGMVSQDIFLFNTSIRANMILAKPEASEADMRSALTKAGLMTFIESQDKGLDAPVGENGRNLSGGQRQRLSLAVLFLRDPQIIIIDEGTSSVDGETERHILQSLGNLHRDGRTIILSSHRESAMIHTEVVYEIKDGLLSHRRRANDASHDTQITGCGLS
jgi:ABC-type multidrug transport system fused ATPase/permease subunit